MNRSFLLIFLFFLVAINTYAQQKENGGDPIQTGPSSLALRLQEKVYIQTDKSYYYPGEVIWLSGFMNYRSPGMFDTLSKVLFIELITPQNTFAGSAILQIDSGRIQGNISLPTQALPGAYLLRAYTNWMRNYGPEEFFYKSIPILNEYDRPDIRETVPSTSDETLLIKFDKPSYQAGDKIKMKLSLRAGTPHEATMAVSITDNNLTLPIAGNENILKDFSFSNPYPKGMLPQFKYPVERGLSFEAAYVNKKGIPEKTNLTIVQQGFINLYTVQTRDDGGFTMHDLAFFDSSAFAIQSGKGKVFIKHKENPRFPRALPHLFLPIVTSTTKQYSSPIDTSKVIMLKSVDVTSKTIYQNPMRHADDLVTTEKLAGYTNLAMAIQARVLYFKLVFSNNHYYLMYNRGTFTGEPAFFIDNTQIFISSGETVGDRLSYIDMSTIDHVEANTSMNAGQGANGAFGAIYLYTKKDYAANFRALPSFKIRGFDRPKSFQAYISKTYDKSAGIFPATVYWNPKINLNNARTDFEVSFNTSNQKGKYRIVIEGLKKDGTPFRSEAEVFVE